MTRSVIKGLGIVALTLFVAAGCGSDDEGSSEDPALEQSVREYSADFLGGDATAAYATLSARCQGVLDEEVFTGVVASAAEAFGDAEITDFESDVDGDSATVSYKYDEATLDQADEPWVLEDGTWHLDDC
jgi:hypothetical protein